VASSDEEMMPMGEGKEREEGGSIYREKREWERENEEDKERKR
jgi:hypothetical protein